MGYGISFTASRIMFAEAEAEAEEGERGRILLTKDQKEKLPTYVTVKNNEIAKAFDEAKENYWLDPTNTSFFSINDLLTKEDRKKNTDYFITLLKKSIERMEDSKDVKEKGAVLTIPTTLYYQQGRDIKAVIEKENLPIKKVIPQAEAIYHGMNLQKSREKRTYLLCDFDESQLEFVIFQGGKDHFEVLGTVLITGIYTKALENALLNKVAKGFHSKHQLGIFNESDANLHTLILDINRIMEGLEKGEPQEATIRFKGKTEAFTFENQDLIKAFNELLIDLKRGMQKTLAWAGMNDEDLQGIIITGSKGDFPYVSEKILGRKRLMPSESLFALGAAKSVGESPEKPPLMKIITREDLYKSENSFGMVTYDAKEGAFINQVLIQKGMNLPARGGKPLYLGAEAVEVVALEIMKGENHDPRMAEEIYYEEVYLPLNMKKEDKLYVEMVMDQEENIKISLRMDGKNDHFHRIEI